MISFINILYEQNVFNFFSILTEILKCKHFENSYKERKNVIYYCYKLQYLYKAFIRSKSSYSFLCILGWQNSSKSKYLFIRKFESSIKNILEKESEKKQKKTSSLIVTLFYKVTDGNITKYWNSLLWFQKDGETANKI